MVFNSILYFIFWRGTDKNSLFPLFKKKVFSRVRLFVDDDGLSETFIFVFLFGKTNNYSEQTSEVPKKTIN